MNKTLFSSSLIAGALLAVASFAAAPAFAADAVAAPANASSEVERGRYLATAGDCIACHTAPAGKPMAGGLALASPMGSIYSTNITPSKSHGIGNYSLEQFSNALRHGKRADGANLYPAMPYTAYAKTSDEDIAAMYAYFMQGVEPVDTAAPATALPFPFNIRLSLAAWNAMYHDATPYKADDTQTPEWNRGVYIAEGLGHCSACHTPRDGFSGEKKGLLHLTGGSAEGWDAPALTSATASPLPWTAEDLMQYFRTGFSERHGVAAGPMAPVAHGLAQQSDDDLKALTTYLMSFKDAKAEPGDAAALVSKAHEARNVPMDTQGLRLYEGACMSCHSSDVKNQLTDTNFGSRPQLALNTNMHAASANNAVRALLEGIQSPAHADLGTMPSMRHALSDQQIAALLNAMRAQYGQPEWQNLQATVAQIRKETDPANAHH